METKETNSNFRVRPVEELSEIKYSLTTDFEEKLKDLFVMLCIYGRGQRILYGETFV